MAKAEDPTYVGGDAPGVEPFTENRVDVPQGHAPTLEGPAQGWNPYRGSEAHGVRIGGGQDVAEDSVEEEYRDAGDVQTWSVKDQPPISVVPGFTPEILRRIMGETRVLPLPVATWVKVAEDNPWRTSLNWWVDPAPTGTDKIYFQIGSNNLPVDLCPFITNGGQSVGLYPMEFTNELWIQVVGTPPAQGYRVHLIEERQVKA